MIHFHKNPKLGFSLVELSIVLIIIGLLVAGVSSGSQLIRAAKLNKLIKKVTSIKSNNITFYLIYDEYPGDFSKATTFWGTYNSSSNPLGAINGNGDGTQNGSNGWRSEALAVWHHLELAELIDGSYSRARINQSSGGLIAGTDIPIFSYNSIAPHYISGQLILGTERSGDRSVNPALTTKDAYFIDRKIDDGIQNSGDIRGSASHYGSWTNRCDASDATKYDLALTAIARNLTIWNTL